MALASMVGVVGARSSGARGAACTLESSKCTRGRRSTSMSVSKASAVPPSPMVPPSPADPSAALLLMTAAESCHALSMAAHENEEEAEEPSQEDAPNA